jgi:uncharacterized protein YerC
MNDPLSVIDGASLLALDIEPPRFIVARLIPAGLHLLAGSPKIGKSWLALWLCHQVSSGEKVWEFDTQKCGALYISLWDTLDRLCLRLSRITERGSKDTLFATSAGNLATGLIGQLEAFAEIYPDTGLIVIDTFQRIRDSETESTYANDYREVAKIKALADRFRIAILLIHHLRKAPDSDPFNMVSGSTGIIGAVDSIYVLEKQKRAENAAILHVTGRDIEDMQIKLEFGREPPIWRFAGYGGDGGNGEDAAIAALREFMSDRPGFTGTATELLAAIRDGKTVTSGSGITANNLSRKIRANLLTLEKSHCIKVSFTRSNTARLITLSKVTGDSIFTGVGLSPGDSDSIKGEGVSRKIPSPVTGRDETAVNKDILGDSNSQPYCGGDSHGQN